MKNNKLMAYNERNPKENKVNFLKNWNNKLNNKYFTTIRNVKYATYYGTRINEVFNVYLNKRFIFKAYLHDAQVVRFEDVKTPELFVVDTGYLDYNPVFKRFKLKDTFVLCLFERLEEWQN